MRLSSWPADKIIQLTRRGAARRDIRCDDCRTYLPPDLKAEVPKLLERMPHWSACDNSLSTNAPSFAATGQVVTLTRVTNGRVVSAKFHYTDRTRPKSADLSKTRHGSPT